MREPIQKGRKLTDKDIDRLKERLELQKGRKLTDKDIDRLKDRLLEAGNSNSRRNRQEMAYGGVANKKKKMRGGGEYNYGHGGDVTYKKEKLRRP